MQSHSKVHQRFDRPCRFRLPAYQNLDLQAMGCHAAGAVRPSTAENSARISSIVSQAIIKLRQSTQDK